MFPFSNSKTLFLKGFAASGTFGKGGSYRGGGGGGGEAGMGRGKPDLRRSEEICPLELGPGHSENHCELSL